MKSPHRKQCVVAILFALVVSSSPSGHQLFAADIQPSQKERAEGLRKLQQAAAETLHKSQTVPVAQETASQGSQKSGSYSTNAAVERKIVSTVSLAKLKSIANSELPGAIGRFNQMADNLAKALPWLRGDVDRCKFTAATILKQFQDRVKTLKVGDRFTQTFEDRPAVIPGGLIKIQVDATVVK